MKNNTAVFIIITYILLIFLLLMITLIGEKVDARPTETLGTPKIVPFVPSTEETTLPNSMNPSPVIVTTTTVETENSENFETLETIKSTSIRDYVIEKYSKEITMLAKLTYGEARGMDSRTEQACVMWIVLNRYDSGRFGSSISKVITAKGQFYYREKSKTVDDSGRDLKELAVEVLCDWELEKVNHGVSEKRPIPNNYFFFHGAKGHNWFRKEYKSIRYWDYRYGYTYD